MRKPNVNASLYRLIYCSRNVIGRVMPGVAVDDELRAILATARRRNKADSVTGALLFTVSGFAQVLEGPRETVEQTFERITADPRHDGVTILSFTPTERRSFPDWSMAFTARAVKDGPDPLEHLLADATFAGPRATTGTDVLRLLEKVVRREDEWIAA